MLWAHLLQKLSSSLTSSTLNEAEYADNVHLILSQLWRRKGALTNLYTHHHQIGLQCSNLK